METTMYDDNSQSVKKMKLGMSLELNGGETKAFLRKATLGEVQLATPDLGGLFMLASPDLEKFIIQQNGLVLTTPTPTSQILFPKTVTEEQEAYARGFVDALSELHKSNGGPISQNIKQSPSDTTTMNAYSSSSNLESSPAINTRSVNSMNSQPITRQVIPKFSTLDNKYGIPKIENAQTVPTKVNNGLIPTSVTPINMEDQEAAKLDRKRARNRLAAMRCRNRKLERISRLEDRVAELKEQNSDLAETAASLREQVYQLKQSILDHTQQGCQVMLTHNLI